MLRLLRAAGLRRSAIPLVMLLAAGGAVAPAAAEDLLAGSRPVLVAQNQQQAAQLTVRIQELEDQVRTLTGQIEGLQFQMTQMQQLIDRMTKDNEFRFEQLEGGNGAAAPAAPDAPAAPAPKANTQGALSEPASPMPVAPVSPDVTTSATATADATPQGSIQTLPPLADGDTPSTTDQAGPNPDQPMDLALGESQDPLLNGGNDTLGTLSDQDLGGRPLDLSAPGGDKISNGDAKAQYAAGYDAMTRGDYAFAEDQFQQFIALYPDDPQAPDAANWLGEALLQRQAYTDAAQVLADGYTKYKDSKRAPDMMLKLGIALAGADQHDVACRTFSTLKQRYPNLAQAFRDRLNSENDKAKCPPIA